MNNWDYKVFTVSIGHNLGQERRDAEIQSAMIYWGAQGWEVFNVNDERTRVRVYAKKPMHS